MRVFFPVLVIAAFAATLECSEICVINESNTCSECEVTITANNISKYLEEDGKELNELTLTGEVTLSDLISIQDKAFLVIRSSATTTVSCLAPNAGLKVVNVNESDSNEDTGESNSKEVDTGESNSKKVDTGESYSNQEAEGNSDAMKLAAGGVVGAVGTAAVTAPATVAAGVPVLGALGFTTGGVAMGSVAATVQSYIGSVATGSLFASMQSAGATAVLGTAGVAGLATVGAVGGVVIGGVAGVLVTNEVIKAIYSRNANITINSETD